MDTCRASGRRTADVRFWLTAGTGNLGVTPTGCKPQFYVCSPRHVPRPPFMSQCRPRDSSAVAPADVAAGHLTRSLCAQVLVFGGLPFNPLWATEGISEVTVTEDVVPFKPPMLAEMKSTNYMLNAMTAMAAQRRGGTFGLLVDSSGFFLEACVLNITIVTDGGTLVTPPFSRVLCGTTVRRAMELVRRSVLAPASPGGLLSGVEQRPVHVDEALKAREIILLAGDTHLYAVTRLNGRPVGDGRVGRVAETLRHLLEEDAEAGQEHHQVIPGL